MLNSHSGHSTSPWIDARGTSGQRFGQRLSRHPLAISLLLAVVASGCGKSTPVTPDASSVGPEDAGLPDPCLGAAPGEPGCDAGVFDAGQDAGPETLVLYESVDLDDETLADAAIAVLGTEEKARCTRCHGLTPGRLRTWLGQSQTALECIDGLDPAAASDATTILGCFEDDDRAVPRQLGFLATALHLDWFSAAFSSRDAGSAADGRFITTGQMPRGGEDLLDQDEFNILMTWVERGLPLLDEHLGGPPGACDEFIGPEVSDHVRAMETLGWAAVNRDRALKMYGCTETDTSPLECLSELPLSSTRDYASGWEAYGSLRVLFEHDASSSYWTKSSADGRFVSHGGTRVIDLQEGTVIPTVAWYDPGFFPDNSGFMIQGENGGLCPQSVLESAPEMLTFMEPGCTRSGNAIGLYQHVAAVDGGDYFAVYGQFVSDDGGHEPTLSPVAADFGARSRATFLPLIYTGEGFTSRDRAYLSTPNEGDAVLAPSTRLLLSRRRSGSGQSGYALRSLEFTPEDESYDVDSESIALYCQRGGKVAFSYDERWVVLHRYVTEEDAEELGFTGADDVEFANFRSQGASNIYLMDLLTGQTRRLTNMHAGQYALFPHFRSDGWIYFVVRDHTRTDDMGMPIEDIEYVIASDAALVSVTSE